MYYCFAGCKVYIEHSELPWTRALTKLGQAHCTWTAAAPAHHLTFGHRDFRMVLF